MKAMGYLAALCLILPTLANATPKATLEAAWDDILQGRFQQAIRKAEKPLTALKLRNEKEIIQAHKILGIAYCETGDYWKGQDHFRSLFVFSPSASIGSYSLTPACQNLFKVVKNTRDLLLKRKE